MKWNTWTDLSILSSSISTVKDCHAESKVYLHFHQVAYNEYNEPVIHNLA